MALRGNGAALLSPRNPDQQTAKPAKKGEQWSHSSARHRHDSPSFSHTQLTLEEVGEEERVKKKGWGGWVVTKNEPVIAQREGEMPAPGQAQTFEKRTRMSTKEGERGGKGPLTDPYPSARGHELHLQRLGVCKVERWGSTGRRHHGMKLWTPLGKAGGQFLSSYQWKFPSLFTGWRPVNV